MMKEKIDKGPMGCVISLVVLICLLYPMDLFATLRRGRRSLKGLHVTSDTSSFADIPDPVASMRYADAQSKAEVRLIHELMARGIPRPDDNAELARLLAPARRNPFAVLADPGSFVSELGVDRVVQEEPKLPPSNLYDSARLKFQDSDKGMELIREAERYITSDGVPAGGQWVGYNLFTADGKLHATCLPGWLVVGRDRLLSMEHGADLVEAAECRLYESKHGFIASLTSSADLWSLVPFHEMVADIGGSLYTAKKISDINEKIRNGEQLTVEEAVALKYYTEETARKANKEKTVGWVAGDIARRVPRFIYEFCVVRFGARSYLKSAIRERTRILAVVVFLLLAFAAYFVTAIYQSHVLAFVFGVFALVASGLLWGKASGKNTGANEWA